MSTNILGDVVGELVGEQARVVTLMKPNADPHSFEISAQEAATLRTADLLVSNGLGLEEGLQQHLDAASATEVPTFAHPAIVVAGDIAYVTEPAANSVHAVDLTTGEVVRSVELNVTPNEIAPAVG